MGRARRCHVCAADLLSIDSTRSCRAASAPWSCSPEFMSMAISRIRLSSSEAAIARAHASLPPVATPSPAVRVETPAIDFADGNDRCTMQTRCTSSFGNSVVNRPGIVQTSSALKVWYRLKTGFRL